MEQGGPRTPYETYCYHCGVSFPIGSKKCIHCGGRMGRGRDRFQPNLKLPPQTEETLDDDPPRRSGVLSPVTVLWLVLALGATLYRTCTG